MLEMIEMSRFAVPISEKELRLKILEVFKEHKI